MSDNRGNTDRIVMFEHVGRGKSERFQVLNGGSVVLPSAQATMSSNHLNMYVARNAKGLNSLETLCATMFGTKKGKFNQRQQLQYLREMCIYLSAVASIEDAVFTSIIGYLKDLGDSDADRKLFRTAVYLLIECIAQYGARGELNSKRSTVYTLVTQFEKELKHKTWSARQILVWRSLGSIAHLHHLNPKNEGSDVGSSLLNRLLTSFDELQYPVKQKKSVLFGEDKDFLPKLMSWAAVASGLVRTGEALPRRSWDNLQHGLNCSIYKPLAQHAHRLLYHTARQLTDAKQQLEFFTLLMTDLPTSEKEKGKDKDKDSGTKEAMRLTDPVCGMYYIRALAALAHNCAALQSLQAATAVSAAEAPLLANQPEVVRAIVNLFVAALKYLDSDVKFVTELVGALFNKQDGVQLVVFCNQVLRSRGKGRDPKKNVVALATQALARLLGTPQIAEGVHLSPLLRASEVLGKFLVHRPYTTAREHQSDGDCIAGLWITLRRLYNNYMRPKEGGGALGSDAQRRGRGLSLRQARSPAGAGQSGANCAGYVAPSYWSWPSDNASIATAAVSENPHTLCALLSAQIWMAPDKRYCPKEHALLWSSFVESLLTSWQLVTATLSRDFDVLSLLLPLLSQVFARVQASTVRSAPAASQGGGAISDTAASFLGMDSAKETGVGVESVKELHAYYEPVYVDILLALAEQLVVATRSGIAVTFLQSVWQWLASLTAARANPAQAALQLKYDMARKAAGPSLGGGGLLVPTVGVPAASGPEGGADSGNAFDEHAGRALLQSLVRMSLLAQQSQHLHVASVRPALGTPRPPECSMVMQNLHLSSLWHLADNITLCYGLALETSEGAKGDGHDHKYEHGFASHTEAVLMAVGLLSEAAAQASLPNVRNAAILALVKVTARLVLRQAELTAGCSSDASLALLRDLARQLASVFLSNFSNTLDLTYRHILHQAVAATAMDASLPSRAALGARQEHEQLLLDILSHLFARNGTDAPIQPTTSVYTALHSTLEAMCAVLQEPSKPLSPAVREFLQAQADNKHNSFVLILPPPLPFGADEVEKEPEQPLEHDELSAIIKPKSGTLFSFDDDLLSGWSASSVAQAVPSAAPASSASSGNLLVDLWLMDAPLEPTVAATTHAFDMFGSSAVPLVASKAGFDTSTHLAPPPGAGLRKGSFYRDIYDEDDSLESSPPPSTSAAPAFSAQNSSFGGSFRSSPGGSSRRDSEPGLSTRTTGIAATASTDIDSSAGGDGFAWPGSSAAPQLGTTRSAGDDGFATAPAADGWDAGSSFATASTAPDWLGASTADDGFLPTTASFPSTSGAGLGAWPTDGISFTPLSTGVGSVGSAADDGFGIPPAVDVPLSGLHPSAPTTAPPAFAPAGSTQALSKEELAANAAAKRANRRVTIDPSLGLDGKPVAVGGTPPPAPAKTVHFSPEVAKENGSTNMAGFAPTPASAAATTPPVTVPSVHFGPEGAASPKGTTDFSGFAPTAAATIPGSAPSTAASTAAPSVPTLAPAPTLAAAPTVGASDMSGWGEIPDDFGFGSKPSDPKRASMGPAPVPGSLETLSKSDVAAIAAAKRANRRQSTGSILPTTGGILPATKTTTPLGAATDPFFGAPAPTLAPTKPVAVTQNGWGGSSDGCLSAPVHTAADPFAPTAAVADWTGVSSDGFATAPTLAPAVSAPVAATTTGSADDFQATPADFAPAPAAPYYDPAQGAYAAPGYTYPPVGYSAAQGYPAYDAQYGYGGQQYPGSYSAPGAYGAYPPTYDANGYAYPTAPATGAAPGGAPAQQGGYYGQPYQPYQPYPPAPGQGGAPQQQYGYPGYAYPPQPPAGPNGAQPPANASGQYGQNGQW